MSFYTLSRSHCLSAVHNTGVKCEEASHHVYHLMMAMLK